jgi:hypothetical protein
MNKIKIIEASEGFLLASESCFCNFILSEKPVQIFNKRFAGNVFQHRI